MKWLRITLPLFILLSTGNRSLIAQKEKGEETSSTIKAISAPFAFDITKTPMQQVGRKDYALFIGNSEYNDGSFKTLPNCTFDVEELKKSLESSFGFASKLLKNTTRQDFRSIMKAYQNWSWTDNDQLLIYIAGHGGFDLVSNMMYLVMKDSNKAREENFIPYSDLQNMLQNIKCKHILLVLDVCYGGTPLLNETSRCDLSSAVPPAMSESEQAEYVTKRLQLRTRRVLSSGGKEPVIEGRMGKNSPFASALLQKLTKTANDNDLLTVYDLTTSLRKEIPTVQKGCFDGNDPESDFLFVRKK